jgi:thymidylate synthase (FAD)
MEENYQELLAVWNYASLQKFKDKKKLTSLFRRIIGMGVATGGVWTGNLRALRHIFAMRCDPAAEEEICYVASMMLQRMMEAEPSVFGDFYLEEGYWKPKYWKI